MPSPGSSTDALTTPRRPVRPVRWAAPLLLTGALLAACGGNEEPTAGESPSASATSESVDPSASATPTESPSASATASPTASATPGDDPTEPAPAPASLEDALLTAAELPGLNDDFRWQQGRTGAVGSEPFGWCSRFDALTVGASEGVERQFPSARATDRAGQQVLDLVDETNARRAEQTFRGWHRDCRGRAADRVGPITTVPVDEGDAWWYLSSRAGGEGQWEAFGLVRNGNRITLLRMQHAGQDHSYEPGQDPLERALRTAATKLA